MKRFLTLTLVVLGCFDPDLTQKPCQDDSGCSVGYACSAEKRCMPGVNSSVTDMGTDPRPKRVEVEVRPSGSFYVGTALTDGINDTPSNLRSNPAPFFLDEREVTVADYRACVTAQVCTAPKTGPFGTQGWICSYGVAGKDQHPVTCVTKTQSEDFCKWMGRRLPTEVEWEYAALGLSGAAPTNQRLVFPVALGGNACWNINATCPVAGYVKTYLGQIVNAENTVSLAGMAYGQTVLARAVHAAGLEWDQREAHSAVYDAERTAQLFCIIANAWPR